MYKTDFDKLHKESELLFHLSIFELKNIVFHLELNESDNSLLSKKYGVLKYIKKLIPSFDIISDVSELKHVQTLLTLQRMVVDNYSIIYLLTSFSSKNEQLLRYYLLLLDGTKSRPKIIENFSSKSKTNFPTSLINKAKKIQKSDNNATFKLYELIKQKNLNSLVNENIINTSNWKFKDSKVKKGKNYYSWTELYKISRIPENQAEMFQNYHSNYVHGLGISLFLNEEDNLLPFVISTLDFCSVIISLILKILTKEYPEEIKNIEINENIIEFMNLSWNKHS